MLLQPAGTSIPVGLYGGVVGGGEQGEEVGCQESLSKKLSGRRVFRVHTSSFAPEESFPLPKAFCTSRHHC